MAWAVWAENSPMQYTPQQLRQLDSVFLPVADPDGRPLGANSGRRLNSFLVTLSGTTINIGPGSGVIDYSGVETLFTLTPASTGAYRVALDAPDTSLSVAAAHATLPRVDMVCVTVYDTDVDGLGQRAVLPTYTMGTAASTPARPTIPARSLPIALINVPAQGSGSPSVTQVDYVLPNVNNPPLVYSKTVSGVGTGGFVGTAPAHWAPADFVVTPVRTGPAFVRLSTSAIGVTSGFGFGYHRIYRDGQIPAGALGDTVVVEGAPLQYNQSFIIKTLLFVGVTTTFQIYTNASSSGGSWRYQFAAWDITQY